MNQLSLSENSILVVPQALQTKTLKKLKAQHLFPSKIITLEELKSKYFFSYDEQATYYLMKKYNYQYDVANMYLSHLSEVSDQDYNQSKIKTIINLKHELDQEHLLYYHPSFQEYAHEKQFIFYQIEESDKRNNLLITALKQVATISFYQEDSPEYSSQSLYEFSTIEEEVDFIATKTDEKLYIQVTESMVSEDVRRRELAPLQRIRDNYEKIVLSMDTGLDSSYDGIKSLNLIQWLLG